MNALADTGRYAVSVVCMGHSADAKHYADAFRLNDKAVVTVGLNFTVTDETNVQEWAIG